LTQQLCKDAEPHSHRLEIQENRNCLQAVEIWLSRFDNRVCLITGYLEDIRQDPVFGETMNDSFEAAVKAHPFTMRYLRCSFETRWPFISQIDEAQVSDAGLSDNEVEGESSEGLDGDLGTANTLLRCLHMMLEEKYRTQIWRALKQTSREIWRMTLCPRVT